MTAHPVIRSRPLRVIQWATGKLGSSILRESLLNPEIDVVGCFVYSESKAGRDIGEIAGLPHVGVAATMDRDEIYSLEADLVFHCPQLQPTMDEPDSDVAALLESGKNVISIVGYSYPPGLGSEHSARLQKACELGNASLMGTGINPGFVSERLATTLTGLCLDIKHVHVLEAYDCTCAPPMMLAIMGFGQDPDAYEAMGLQEVWDAMYLGIIYDVVDRPGGRVDHIEKTHELFLSPRDQLDESIPVPVTQGTVAGTKWQWTVLTNEAPFYTLEFHWYVGAPIPDLQKDSGWTITIDGTPSLQASVRTATSVEDLRNHAPAEYDDKLMAALVLNAAPDVVAAPAGFMRVPVFAPYRRRMAPSL